MAVGKNGDAMLLVFFILLGSLHGKSTEAFVPFQPSVSASTFRHSISSKNSRTRGGKTEAFVPFHHATSSLSFRHSSKNFWTVGDRSRGSSRHNVSFLDVDVCDVSTKSDDSTRRFGPIAYLLSQATFVGIVSGCAISLFKLSIDAVKRACYGSSISSKSKAFLPLIPTLGGIAVGLLGLWGGFPPGLKGIIDEVEEGEGIRNRFGFLRKTLAAVFTLGTGCSLGPEGPSVEIGMFASRLTMGIFPPVFLPFGDQTSVRELAKERLLLCCGAAAGVSAGFNAPLSGVFFALEIMQASFPPFEYDQNNDCVVPVSLTSTSRNISAILLSSVASALVARTLLGSHLHLILNGYKLGAPLAELPLYLLLGGLSGVTAFLFNQTVQLSGSFFAGTLGPRKIRDAVKSVPVSCHPVIGGLLCGVVGLAFPQILFFGYETLNSLLSNCSLPMPLLLSLLGVKGIMTGISSGSGLVGGFFAPSLFLGAMLGGAFHNTMSFLFHLNSEAALFGSPFFQLADIPAHAMVGSASVLAALFKAPLTASLLLFELTRDYDVILPLMASAGVAAVVRDILESKFRGREAMKLNDCIRRCSSSFT